MKIYIIEGKKIFDTKKTSSWLFWGRILRYRQIVRSSMQILFKHFVNCSKEILRDISLDTKRDLFFFFFFLPTSWRWWTTLNSNTPNSPDTRRVLLTGFGLIAWSSTSNSMLLNIADLAWQSRFLQHERNFFNLLVAVLWSTLPSLSLSNSISSWMRLYRTFICTAFKLLTDESIHNVIAHQPPR